MAVAVLGRHRLGRHRGLRLGGGCGLGGIRCRLRFRLRGAVSSSPIRPVSNAASPGGVQASAAACICALSPTGVLPAAEGDLHPDDYDKLIALTYTFCRFGKIHPFLDGNGHAQRAVFAVMATEFGFPLSPRFAIHPRPFDRLLAIALETFTRAPADEEQEDLGLVAEYLAFLPRRAVQCPAQACRDRVALHVVKASTPTRRDPGGEGEESRSGTPSLTATKRKSATAEGARRRLGREQTGAGDHGGRV